LRRLDSVIFTCRASIDDDAEACGSQPRRQPWSQVASLQRYAINMLGKASHRCGYLSDLGGNITFQANFASLVDDTQRRRSEANIHTYIVSHHNVSHHNLPVSVMATNHDYIRELASNSEQARLRMLSGSSNGHLDCRYAVHCCHSKGGKQGLDGSIVPVVEEEGCAIC
jgi:hypothetical protein